MSERRGFTRMSAEVAAPTTFIADISGGVVVQAGETFGVDLAELFREAQKRGVQSGDTVHATYRPEGGEFPFGCRHH